MWRGSLVQAPQKLRQTPDCYQWEGSLAQLCLLCPLCLLWSFPDVCVGFLSALPRPCRILKCKRTSCVSTSVTVDLIWQSPGEYIFSFKIVIHIDKDIFILCMGVCLLVSLLCTWCLQRPEESIRSPGTGVAEGWESPCGGWESNSRLLQEKQVLLTAQPSLQSPVDHSQGLLWMGISFKTSSEGRRHQPNAQNLPPTTFPACQRCWDKGG